MNPAFILFPDGEVIAYILNPKHLEALPPYHKFCINGISGLRSPRLISATRVVGSLRQRTVCILQLQDGDYVHYVGRENENEEPHHIWAVWRLGELVTMPMKQYKESRAGKEDETDG